MIKTFNFSSNGLPNPDRTGAQLIGFSRQEAFVCLYDAYVSCIQEDINRRVSDQKLAEDLAARVFLEAWEKLPTYQSGEISILAWLHDLAHNVIVAHYQPAEAWIHEQTRLAAQARRQVSRDKPRQSTESRKMSVDEQQQVLIQSFLTISAVGEAAPEADPRRVTGRLDEIRALRKLASHLAVKADETADNMQLSLVGSN